MYNNSIKFNIDLQVDRRIVTETMHNKESWKQQGEYTGIVSKVHIKRSKKPVVLKEAVVEWF